MVKAWADQIFRRPRPHCSGNAKPKSPPSLGRDLLPAFEALERSLGTRKRDTALAASACPGAAWLPMAVVQRLSNT
jgi:hypothetical protein